MKRGYAWLGIGTHDNLLPAGQFNAALEHRQGLRMACTKEVAWCNGFINDENPEMLARPLAKNRYDQYLQRLLAEGVPP